MTSLIDRMIQGDAKRYVRERDLPRLLALWDWELEDFSIEGRRNIVAKLERACLAERRRVKHWSYELNRHIALLAAHRAESDALAELMRQQDAASAEALRGLVAAMRGAA